jgi:hypothetical protein
MSKRFNKLLEEFKKLSLPDGQYAIFGSGPLAIRGIRKAQDLDVVVRAGLCRRILRNHPKARVGCIKIGNIEIIHTGRYSKKVIEKAEMIKGFRFTRLKDLKIEKKKMGREKDFKDIELIDDYLKKRKV